MGNRIFASRSQSHSVGMPIPEKEYYKLWQPNNNNLWSTAFEVLPYLNDSLNENGVKRADVKGILIIVEKKYFAGKYFGDETVYPLPTEVAESMTAVANSYGIAENSFIISVQGYVEYVQYCLDLIYKTPGGKRLLDFLRTAGLQITINLTDSGNKVFSTNVMCDVSEILIDSALSINPTESTKLKRILNQLSHQEGDASYTWLAEKINKSPLLSHFGVLFKDSGYLIHKQAKVRRSHIKKWLNEGKFEIIKRKFTDEFFPGRSVTNIDFIQQAIMVALYGGATAGSRSSSGVMFNVKNEKHNEKRPPAIGLAHELVHAYYNATGMQPGFDNDSVTTVLYEMICVGLGPWDNELSENATRFSENRFRKEWHHVRDLIKDSDRFNKLPTPKRTSYIPSAK